MILRLATEFDLVTFRVLPVNLISDIHGVTEKTVYDNINTLERVGILERGPMAKRGMLGRGPTYRIRPRFFLTPADLKKHFEDRRTLEERMTVYPLGISEDEPPK